MDPKRTTNQYPPACPEEGTEPEAEVWEPPFERWQRLTEALIGSPDAVSPDLAALRRPPRG